MWSTPVSIVILPFAALGVRLAGALYLFWWAYGYHVEGYQWTQQLLERLASDSGRHARNGRLHRRTTGSSSDLSD